VLRHLLTLRAGDWPDPEWNEPAPITRVSSFMAKYIGPCEMAGEVEMRLAICGFDGYLVKQVYAWGESYDYLSKNLHISSKEMNRGIRTAIDYITGKWPMEETYREYRKRHKNKGGKQ